MTSNSVFAFGFALAAPLALLSSPALAAKAKPAAPSPSLDCATVLGGEVERAICANPAIAALDRRIADRFDTLRRSLPQDAAMGLADDQQYFTELRNLAFKASGGNAAVLQATLAQRAAFLDAVVVAAPDATSGTWANFMGEMTVADDGSVLIVEAQPTYGERICRISGKLAGSPASGRIAVAGQPSRVIELERLGLVIVVTDRETTPSSACTLNGGPFFRTAAKP